MHFLSLSFCRSSKRSKRPLATLISLCLSPDSDLCLIRRGSRSGKRDPGSRLPVIFSLTQTHVAHDSGAETRLLSASVRACTMCLNSQMSSP